MNNAPGYVVVDTNVLISAALLPRSKTAQVLEMALERFVIAQSEATWLEFETKMALSKFDKYLSGESRIRFMTRIAQVSKFFQPEAKIAIGRDPDDAKFISLALVAGAKIIISGDDDLLAIGRYGDIEMLSPGAFFDRGAHQ